MGGNAVNVGVQLRWLGASVAYFGAVGDDADGALVASGARQRGIDLTGLVVRGDRPTSRTTIVVDETGDRRIEAEDFGACDGYAPDGAALAALEGMDHVHIGWLNDGGILRRHCVRAALPVSQDNPSTRLRRNLGVDGLAVAFVSASGSHARAAPGRRAPRRWGARRRRHAGSDGQLGLPSRG